MYEASASKCPHGTTATHIPRYYVGAARRLGVHHRIMRRKKGNPSDRVPSLLAINEL
ncbi:hypothetical protein PAXRUDRAFT_825385 [Paxillus rubicundulus Ve08.2h10]|uniref:Uncharacterized protein n=1 Tax=Paxillus rubicundulus Ve08.2h10 TaxID=930991 RepID=A0A0D0DTA6_9AGAM|nr:hypothetical protein PAXRUDRAFT_825385 [Paxillus rubicundulus Ve08.2h10]